MKIIQVEKMINIWDDSRNINNGGRVTYISKVKKFNLKYYKGIFELDLNKVTEYFSWGQGWEIYHFRIN